MPRGATALESSPLEGASIRILPGQYADKETNTSYNHFRDYDPAIGRYVQSDPIGLQGGFDTYLYVGGAPLRFYDLDGLDRWAGESSPAIVYTNMAAGWTMFYDPFTSESVIFETSNAVASTAQRGAGGPYSGFIRYCQVGTFSTGFGTAKVYTDDPRQRWIHGGGTGLAEPFAPRQGWVPTLGCTRGQNEDVENLCKKVRAFQKKFPVRAILYRRD